MLDYVWRIVKVKTNLEKMWGSRAESGGKNDDDEGISYERNVKEHEAMKDS